MGYLFQALPADLLTAEPPQLSAIDQTASADKRLAGIFLSTLLAVPEFRARVLQLAGARSAGGDADVYCDVQFRGGAGGAASSLPNGMIRLKGGGAFTALVDVRRHAFGDRADDVRAVAEHLALARDHRVQRLIAVANTLPDQAFIEAVRNHPSGPPVDRMRGLTWMETLDIAFHLLERKVVRKPSGVFLLEQYIRVLKEETVRDLQARSQRPEGALFFGSLGRDWPRLVQDIRQGQIDSRDPRLQAGAANWLSLLRFLSLYLIRGSLRDEDVLSFPSVKAASLTARKDLVVRRLIADGKLLATFAKHDEAAGIVLGVDLRQPLIRMQIEIDGPSQKGVGQTVFRDLAASVRDDRTTGSTLLKVFWPGEKAPRVVTRQQAIDDPIATAPPAHDMVPDRFVIERTVPCDAIIGEPDSFVQLLMLELRGFRASVRHVLHRGLRGG